MAKKAPRIWQRDGKSCVAAKLRIPKDKNADITITLPSGKVMQLQWRVEGTSPSMDVCLPYDTPVTNWKGDDMADAPVAPSPHPRQHIRIAKQLVIDFKPDEFGSD